MAIVWIAFLLSAIMCTGAQYIYLNENNDYVSNYEVMVQIQRLMTQQGKIRESVDSLRQMFERLSTHSGVKIIKKGCDPGWVKYKTHCYFIGKRKVSWIEAMYECEARCSHVVEIETKEESDWLARTLLFN
ncbi:low affinity immunoglobulin epsilon Fc receptor-like, partial [Saccostrea cucullata]|uniref:low affinity immunoglobulin epsilon Fc receptor-like n=1 Tax=Saccostrea cuccullata TaxID=36930 RepID=UPI002ED5C72A